MTKLLAVLYADSHLADRAWAGRDIEGDAYYSFKQIIDYAIEHNSLAVIGAGDLIDRSINRSRPIAEANWQMERLKKAEIRALYLQGQHELATPPWLSSHTWPEHIDHKMVKLGSVDFYGLDFTPSPFLQTELAQIPAGADVGIFHQVWAENMGSIANPQGSMADVPKVSVVFSGDYHVTKETYTHGKDGQKLRLISPGSTCLQSVDEDPCKFFYTVDEDFKWSQVQLKTRYKLEWSINHPNDIDALMQQLDHDLLEVAEDTASYDECVRKPILRVHYLHRFAEHRERIIKAVDQRAHLFWHEIPPEPELQVVARRQAAAAKGERRAATLLSELPEYLKQREMLHLMPECRRLLESQDLEAELSRLREEALNGNQEEITEQVTVEASDAR